MLRRAAGCSRQPSRRAAPQIFVSGRCGDECEEPQASHPLLVRPACRFDWPLVNPTSVTAQPSLAHWRANRHGILTNRAKIRRKPVANVDEPFTHHRVMLSDGNPLPGALSRLRADACWLRCSRCYAQPLAVASRIAHHLAVDPVVGRAQPINEHGRGRPVELARE